MKSRIVTIFLAAATIFLLYRCEGALFPGETEDLQNSPDSEIHQEKVRAVFNPSGKGMFDLPFPTDLLRLSPSGVDLSGFPNPKDVPALKMYLDYGSMILDGFGLTQTVYFRFDGAIDAKSIPAPQDTPFETSPVWLVNVDKKSGEYGKLHPFEFLFIKEKGMYLEENTLMIRPLFGIPLREKTTYAAIVFIGLKDAYGEEILASGEFGEFLNGDEKESPLGKIYAPLREFLNKKNIAAGKVAAATVFTTSEPLRELRLLRDYIRFSLGGITAAEIEFDSETDKYYLYKGFYYSPNFLRGEPPYLSEGDFNFDENGGPEVASVEKLDFALTVPKNFGQPDGGFPLVIQSHGTGGDYMSFVNSGKFKIADELSDAGLAAIGIDQPLHGNRMSPPLSDIELELYSFNYLNPRAGRSVQRQSVCDNVALMKMLETGFSVPQSVSRSGKEIEFNGKRLLFMGHSQGGITGAMFFGVEPLIAGGVFSGSGGGLSITLMERKDLFDIEAMIREAFWIDDQDELTTFHPVIMLIQMIADATDPLNYAPFYFTSDGDTGPRDVLITEGLFDDQTPPSTTDALAAAARIPLLWPPAKIPVSHNILGLSPVYPPVSDNITADGKKATAALIHFPENDHFAIYQNHDAVAYYQSFLASLGYSGTAIIK